MTIVRRSVGAAALGIVVLVGGACGSDNGDDAGAATTRTVRIEMRDVAYSPDSLTVEAGETVRVVFTNVGKLTHDAFIGDEAAQAEHEKEMMRSDDADMGHGADHGETGVTVEPGKTGRITYTFDKAGTTIIGCHQAGHYAAGMKVEVRVT